MTSDLVLRIVAVALVLGGITIFLFTLLGCSARGLALASAAANGVTGYHQVARGPVCQEQYMFRYGQYIPMGSVCY